MEHLLKRLLVGFLLLLPYQASAYVKGTNTVDMLTDMEAGNPGDLVTSNLLYTCSHTNGAIGYWLVSTNQILTLTNLNNATPRGPTIISTTPYTGSGDTKSFVLDLKPNLTRQYATFNLATSRANISVGFAFRFKNGGASTGDLYDLFAFENGASFFVLSVEQRTGNASKIGIETDVPPGPSGSGYKQFNDDTPYWITMRWNKNAAAEFRMYDMSTWNLYYATNLTIANVNCTTLYIGRYDAHDGNHPNDRVFYDNLTVDLTGVNWPLLPPGATVAAATTGWTDVSNAVFSTSWGGNNQVYDVVSLPNSSNLWAGAMIITNTCMIRGTGTNSNQSVIRTAVTGANAGLDLSATFTKLRDFQFRGAPKVASDCWGIIFNANNCSCSNLLMSDLLSPFVSNVPFGVVYNSTTRNSSRLPGRCFGAGSGQPNWDNFTPFNGTSDYAKTNFFVFEDMANVIDSDMDPAITGQPCLTSQQGALWVVRRCLFKFTIAYDLQPSFDSHGETDPGPLRGNIAVQVYSNRFDYTSGTWNKFADIRGGAALVYSNNCTGTISTTSGNCTVYMREKTGETADYNNDPVTNCWFCANIVNGSAMPNEVEADDTAKIIEGIHFHQTCLSPLFGVPYPHPLRNEVASGGGGGGGSTVNPPARLQRIILTK